MGLERIASVLQGVDDNFETDLFSPLINLVQAQAKVSNKVSALIIADHARAVTFLIADGVYPGNAGRGYILRRLIRRAISHGRRLGIDRPFLVELATEVVKMMAGAYPELAQKQDFIAKVINEEEQNFLATLEQGMKWFEEVMAKRTNDKTLSGAEAFRLHDTYGFPIDLTVELAREKGLAVDLPGFEKEMAGQRDRARNAGVEGGKKRLLTGLDLSHLKPTNFTGYEKNEDESKVTGLFPEQKLVVLEKTPFYGESGGQVGDTGLFSYNGKETRVVGTLISPSGVVLHEVDDVAGLKDGSKVKALIDASKRKATEAHHTATHLLHKALREVLGDHVKQAGSYVGPDKLRFDFSHFHAMSLAEMQKVEQLVNEKIKEKIKVEVLKKSHAEAVKMGAMALFGEKYGDQVRVLRIDSYSLELCGGTHVKNTGDILFFKIISEGALGAGVRRIEALAGQAAKVYVIYKAKSLHDGMAEKIKHYRSLQVEKEKLGAERTLETNIFEIELTELERLSKAVDTQDSINVNKFLDHLCGRADWLNERIGKAEKEVEELRNKKVKGEAAAFSAEAADIGGKKVLLKEFNGYSMEMLRSISDTLQQELKSCVLLLASALPQRLIYLIIVTPDLAAQGVSAKDIAAAFSNIVGGKGGGKETKVEGGGKDPSKIGEGFKAVVGLLGG
ncbi:MAG: alanine--tRNA ligase, partial [Candidatus Margulisbacteria bacterium]|nr:alanine--tRNA ligase [Candidatus Margulisiibacteriota bacterium]